jgi:SAM domain (Sterile alpha motif)
VAIGDWWTVSIERRSRVVWKCSISVEDVRSVMQPIAELLANIGVERYAPAFADNDIDVSVLPHLTDADLEKIGVSLGHRRKILAAVAGTITDRSAERLPSAANSPICCPSSSAQRRSLPARALRT